MDDKRDVQQGWESYVLLPATDVPQSGSRTEIIVTPSRCLRVEARVLPDGRLELRLAQEKKG